MTSRRKWLMGAAGAAGAAVTAKLADGYGLIPPDWRGVWGPGETLTYAVQRLMSAPGVMAREFPAQQISKVAPISGKAPKKGPYVDLLANGFKDWRLTVDGMVERPGSYSLDDLRAMPSRSQITEQACEEGWCFVAQWTGVPLSHVLNTVGVKPGAKFVAVFGMDDLYDSIDMNDAWHAQTMIAYRMNGEDLTADRGAPVRLKVARQLGYKSVKFLSRVLVTDSMKKIGTGNGSSEPDGGYSWYAGI